VPRGSPGEEAAPPRAVELPTKPTGGAPDATGGQGHAPRRQSDGRRWPGAGRTGAPAPGPTEGRGREHGAGSRGDPLPSDRGGNTDATPAPASLNGQSIRTERPGRLTRRANTSSTGASAPPRCGKGRREIAPDTRNREHGEGRRRPEAGGARREADLGPPPAAPCGSRGETRAGRMNGERRARKAGETDQAGRGRGEASDPPPRARPPGRFFYARECAGGRCRGTRGSAA